MNGKKQHHFENEEMFTEEFVRTIANTIPKRNGFNRRVMMREIDCDRGRADIVYAFVDDKDNELQYHAERLSKALLQIAKAKIISRLGKKKYCEIEYLIESTGYTRRTIQKHLNELIKLHVVKKNKVGCYKLEQSFKLPNAEVWAFELKLTNWKRALYQALRYRGFSHNVAVVMPKGRVEVAKRNLSIFKRMNVGLAEISDAGELLFIKMPRKSKPTSESHYLYSLGHILSEFDESNAGASSKVSKSLPPLSKMPII